MGKKNQISIQKQVILMLKVNEVCRITHDELAHNSKTKSCSIRSMIYSLNHTSTCKQYRQKHLPDGTVGISCLSFEDFEQGVIQ